MLILVKQHEKIIPFFMLNFCISVFVDKDKLITGECIGRLMPMSDSDNRRLNVIVSYVFLFCCKCVCTLLYASIEKSCEVFVKMILNVV